MNLERYGRPLGDEGTVSFALIAVLLILLSIISVAYMSRIDRLNYASDLKKDRISSMENNLQKVYSDIESRLRFIAIRSIYGSKTKKRALEDIYLEKVDAYIERKIDNGGWRIGNDIVSTSEEGYRLKLKQIKKKVSDIKKEAALSKRSKYNKINNEIPGQMGFVNRSFSYGLEGYLVLNIKSEKYDLEMEKNHSVNIDVDVPYPFFDKKMNSFQTSIKGKSSDLGRMMRYILTTISQYRVLMGYGMEKKEHTNKILIKKDIEIALNLALLLEMCYKFRSYNPENLKALEKNCDVINSNKISALIENYTDEGTLDPSDIITLFYGYGFDEKVVNQKSSKSIDIADVIAQSLYGILDQYVIKYLEYFGLDIWADFAYKGLQFLSDLLDKAKDFAEKYGGSLLDLAFDNKKKGVTDDQIKSVKRWVEKIFIKTGLGPADLLRNNYTIFDQFGGEKVESYPDLSSGSEFTYNIKYKGRLTSEEHRWFAYNCSHGKTHRGKSDETCDEMVEIKTRDGSERKVKCGVQDVLIGYDYLEGDVGISLDDGSILFKSRDIMAAERGIWKDLFKRIEKIVDKDYLKDDLKGTLEKIVKDLAGEIMKNTNLESDRYIEVHPDDRKSVLKTIEREIDIGVHETISYYRENPSRIKKIVRQNQRKNKRIKVLKEWLKENYNEIVGKEEYIKKVINKTAYHFTDVNSDHLKIESGSSKVVRGGINEASDFTIQHSKVIDKRNISFIIQNGGIETDSKIDDIKNDIEEDIRKAYDNIREREIIEVDHKKRHSIRDGLIIQAIDAYQFGTDEAIGQSLEVNEGNNIIIEENEIGEVKKDERVEIDKKISPINETNPSKDKNEFEKSNKQGEYKKNSKDAEMDFNKNSICLNSARPKAINSVPIANFNYTPDNPDTLDKVTFTDISKDEGDIVNRTWIIEDKGVYYGPKIEYNFSDDGNYDVTLNVTDDQGNEDQINKTISVKNTPPFVNFEIDPLNKIKTRQNITFSQGSRDIDGTIDKIEWDFGDGNKSNKTIIEHNFSDDGYYDVTLTVWDDDGYKTYLNKTIFVDNRKPSVSFQVSSSVITEGGSISFSDRSKDIDGIVINRTWIFGDGSEGFGKNPRHTYTQPGNYEVTLRVEDDDGKFNRTTKEIVVDDSPFIKDISPENDSSWNVNQEITVKFSENVDKSSLVYSVTPDIEFDLDWRNGNTVVFHPKNSYNRKERYEFKISDIVDKDNSINSSLKNEVVTKWTTEDFASVKSYYPYQEEVNPKTVPTGRSIILVFSESIKGDISLDSLIECSEDDVKWEYSLNDRILRLDHSSFDHGKRIKLKINLHELETSSDGTVVTENGKLGDTDLKIIFRTADRKTKPNIVKHTLDDNGYIGGGEIEFTFDREMDKDTFSYHIFPSISKENIEEDWNQKGTAVEMKFHDLKECQTYKLWMNIDGVSEEKLNSTVNPVFFKTRDITTPEVISFSHDKGDGYLANAPVTIKFSESMKPDEFEFNCKPIVNNWKESWNDDNTVVQLNHDPLSPDQKYKFYILYGEDENDNPLMSDDKKSYYFTVSDNGEKIEVGLLEKKIYSIIGKGAGKFSLFNMLESFLTKTTTNIVRSNKMANLEYRLPLNVGEGFEYWSVNDIDQTKKTANELEFDPDMSPNYLELDNEITISKPKGVHYTQINKIAERPFETRWGVNISDVNFKLNLSGNNHDVLFDGSKEILSQNRTFNITFNFSVTVSSGWPLEGINYDQSNTFISDVVDFLDKVWDVIKKSVSYLVDGLQKILKLLENIVDFIKNSAEKIIQLLGKVVREVVVELIRPRLSGMTDIISASSGFEHKLNLMGLTLFIDTEKEKTPLPNYEGKLYRYLNISLCGKLVRNDFNFNLNVLENDVVCFGKFSVGGLDADWQMDPMYNPKHSKNDDPFYIYDSWFKLQGETSNSYLNLTSPIDTTVMKQYETSLGEYTPIDETKIPIGPVVVTGLDLGIRFEYEDIGQIRSIFLGMLDKVYRDTIRTMDGTSFSFQYVIEFVKTLVRKFVKEIISFVKKFVKSMVIFFNACINGVDIELTFGINSSKGVREFVVWIAKAVKDAFTDIIDKELPSLDVKPPRSLYKNIDLGIETGLTDNMTAYFRANIPALATLADIDLGRWKITFGIVMPTMEMISGTLVEK